MNFYKTGFQEVFQDSRVIPAVERVAVTAGTVCIDIQVPPRGEHQAAFDVAPDTYQKEAEAA